MKTTLKYFPVAALLLMLTYASFSKLLDWSDFRAAMFLQPFPPFVAITLGYLLPPAELSAAALLLFPGTQRAGLLLCLLLTASFCGYAVLAVLHFWSRAPCPCGGLFSRLHWPAHLLINALLLLLNILALSINGERRNP